MMDFTIMLACVGSILFGLYGMHALMELEKKLDKISKNKKEE